jgi:hypothetical protein
VNVDGAFAKIMSKLTKSVNETKPEKEKPEKEKPEKEKPEKGKPEKEKPKHKNMSAYAVLEMDSSDEDEPGSPRKTAPPKNVTMRTTVKKDWADYCDDEDGF